MAMASQALIRAFLALPMASSFQAELFPLVERLKKEQPGIRWVRTSEVHLTLHFFGPIASEEIPRISKIVTPLADKTGPMDVFLKGLGAFPNLRSPRVIWVGVEGELSALKSLQDSIERNLCKAGFSTEERGFKPHLTLGRVKDKVSKGPLELGGKDFTTAPRKIKEAVLFQSQLTPEGSHYEAIATYPFTSS